MARGAASQDREEVLQYQSLGAAGQLYDRSFKTAWVCLKYILLGLQGLSRVAAPDFLTLEKLRV